MMPRPVSIIPIPVLVCRSDFIKNTAFRCLPLREISVICDFIPKDRPRLKLKPLLSNWKARKHCSDNEKKEDIEGGGDRDGTCWYDPVHSSEGSRNRRGRVR